MEGDEKIAVEGSVVAFLAAGGSLFVEYEFERLLAANLVLVEHVFLDVRWGVGCLSVKEFLCFFLQLDFPILF